MEKLTIMQRGKIENLLNERKWNLKEFSKVTGIDGRILNEIIKGEIPISEEEYEELCRFIQNEDDSGLINYHEPIIIVSWARKGGNGKTTVATNLAYDLAQMGYKTLAVDGDSQCDLTSTLYPQYMYLEERTIYDAMLRRRDIRPYIIDTDYDNLSIVSGSQFTEELERVLINMPSKIAVDTFKDCFEGVMEDNFYDFIIVDLDKSMGLFNNAILSAASYVLVLAECSFFSVKALIPVKERLEQIQKENKQLKCLGLVFNRVNTRKNEVKKAKADAKCYFAPYQIMNNYLSNDSNVEKSQRVGVPLDVYANSSKVNKQMHLLTEEILNKIRMDIEEE